MKKIILLKTALVAGAIAATAQVNNPASPGCLERGKLMIAEGNFQGALDQLSLLERDRLSGAEREQAAWLRALATYRGGYADAGRTLGDFLEAYPASVHRIEATVFMANTLLETEPARALAIYESLGDINPGEPLLADLTYHRGYALMRLGEFDRALRDFMAVISGTDFSEEAQFYFGYIQYVKHDYAKAVPFFEKAVRTKLPGAAADYYLAQIYYVQGEYRQSLACARDMLANPTMTDPAFTAEANRIAGEALYALGRTDEALPYLERYAAAAEAPEPGALYILGTARYSRGDYEQAVACLEPVTTVNTAMGQSAYLYVGEALMKLGRTDAALMAFDNALRRDFDPAVQEAAYYNYAVAKFGGGSIPFGSSAATFEDFLRRYPDGPYTSKVQEYLVAGYLTDHDYDTALASINRMTNPGAKVLEAKQQILYALGTRALAADDAAAARDYLLQALALQRYNPSVGASTRLSLGEALYRLGDFRGAVNNLDTYLSTAARDDANLPLGRYDLGYARFALKEYPQAAKAFRAFADAPGKLPATAVADAYNRLADIALYDGRLDEAAGLYGRAYDKAPASGDYALFQQAVIKGYQRDYNAKIKTIDRLLADFPSSTLIPDALLEKTEGYLQLNRPDDAIAIYRRLVADYPATEQGRKGYVQLAMTLLNTGDRAGAVETYRELVRQSPTSDEALVAVEELQRIAAADGTLGDVAAFLESVENAPQLDIAEADRLTFEAAETAYADSGTTARIASYLTQFPTGAYRAQAWNYMMEDAVEAGHTGDALTFATLIVENYPDTRLAEDALAVKASAEHSLGMGANALASWQELARRASTPAMLNRARTGIMRVAHDMADNALVIENADALLASSTAGTEDRNEAIFMRGMARLRSGDSAAARADWQAIAGLTDDINGVKSALYMGQSYFDDNLTADARRTAEAIIDSAPPHTYWLARAFILLSDVLARQDQKFEAREYLKSLRENYPGSETDIFQMIDTRLNTLK